MNFYLLFFFFNSRIPAFQALANANVSHLDANTPSVNGTQRGQATMVTNIASPDLAYGYAGGSTFLQASNPTVGTATYPNYFISGLALKDAATGGGYRRPWRGTKAGKKTKMRQTQGMYNGKGRYQSAGGFNSFPQKSPGWNYNFYDIPANVYLALTGLSNQIQQLTTQSGHQVPLQLVHSGKNRVSTANQIPGEQSQMHIQALPYVVYQVSTGMPPSQPTLALLISTISQKVPVLLQPGQAQ